MYRLHIANKNYSSWSLRAWLLMQELGIAFQEVLHPFGAEEDWQQYRRINPSALVPCLIDDDMVVWDSIAIIEYLAERHPGVWPDDDKARAWARCATAEMHSGFVQLRQICSMSCGQRLELKEITPPLTKDLERLDMLWQHGLQTFSGPFLAGKLFTAADAFYAPVVFRLQTYGLQLGRAAMDYAHRMLALDSMRNWYQQALHEPYRDESHDREIAAFARQTADLRQV